MIVVSDTTAITTLIKIGQEWLLRQMFNEVIVPQAVWDELSAFHSQLPDFISLRRLADPHQRMPGTELLGHGEAEAIGLAKEIGADVLLTDDRKARAAAARLGIRMVGLLGVLVQAKQTGRIQSVRNMMETLESKGGFYLSDAARIEALKLSGEESG